MKDLMAPPFHHWRRYDPEVMEIYGSFGNAREGAFYLPAGTNFEGYRANTSLAVIATAADGWDHVSVSGKNRTPNWHEMMLVHRIFFEPDEYSLQYCVPKNDHVNCHPHTLHLWRPWAEDVITFPPIEMV